MIKLKYIFKKTVILGALLAYIIADAGIAKADPLPSWNDRLDKAKIITFVNDVTNQKSIKYVEPEERIAVFDNEGTLWPEQPIYFQMMYAIDRIKEMAPQHPEWKKQQP